MANLYRISQDYNQGWDTYDSAVVVARNADEAKKIHPHGGGEDIEDIENFWRGTWAYEVRHVKVEYLGQAADELKEGTVIVASFNAG